MKKKIVIIGAGCFQKALIEKAKEMGVETHVFAWEEGAVGKGAADFFYPVSIREKEKILKQCKRIRRMEQLPLHRNWRTSPFPI